MNVLYPRITWRQAGWLLVFGLAGSYIAGTYGVLHDEVTYSIGPEYFTRLKFDQFYYLSRDQPLRLLVAEIGFLATWWVGFFAGWFMGRVTLPHESVPAAAARSIKGVLIIVASAFVFALVANAIAPRKVDDPRLSNWVILLSDHDVIETIGFVRVAYIHNAGYLGALVGLISVLVWLRLTRPVRSCQGNTPTIV